MKNLLLVLVFIAGIFLPTSNVSAASQVCSTSESCISFVYEECEEKCTTTVKITPLQQGVTLTVASGWSVKLVGGSYEISHQWRAGERNSELKVTFGNGGIFTKTFAVPKSCKGVFLPVLKISAECENPTVWLTWRGYARAYPVSRETTNDFSLPELPGGVPITLTSSEPSRFRQYAPYYHNYGVVRSITIDPANYLGKQFDVWVETPCGSVWFRTYIDPFRAPKS